MKIENEDTTDIWIVWIVGFLIALVFVMLIGCEKPDLINRDENYKYDSVIIDFFGQVVIDIDRRIDRLEASNCNINRKELIQIIDSINEQRARITQGLLVNVVGRQMAMEKALKDFENLADKKFSSLENKPCNIDSLYIMIQNVLGNYIIRGDELAPATKDSLLKILEPLLK